MDTGIQPRDSGLPADVPTTDASPSPDAGLETDSGALADSSVVVEDTRSTDSGVPEPDVRSPSADDAGRDAGPSAATRGGCGCTTPTKSKSPTAPLALGLATRRRAHARR